MSEEKSVRHEFFKGTAFHAENVLGAQQRYEVHCLPYFSEDELRKMGAVLVHDPDPILSHTDLFLATGFAIAILHKEKQGRERHVFLPKEAQTYPDIVGKDTAELISLSPLEIIKTIHPDMKVSQHAELPVNTQHPGHFMAPACDGVDLEKLLGLKCLPRHTKRCADYRGKFPFLLLRDNRRDPIGFKLSHEPFKKEIAIRLLTSPEGFTPLEPQ